MIRFTKTISYIFHPVFMPLLGVLIIFNSGIYNVEVPFEFKRFIYAIVGLCTIVLPLTFVPALYFFKMIQQITIDERRERLIPLFFTVICLYLGYFFLNKFSPILLITHFLFACVLVVLFVLFISVLWKISIHMAGIGGIVSLVIALSMFYNLDMTFFFVIAILLAGIIGSARLALNAHSFSQIIAGFALGMLVVGGILFLQLKR